MLQNVNERGGIEEGFLKKKEKEEERERPKLPPIDRKDKKEQKGKGGRLVELNNREVFSLSLSFFLCLLPPAPFSFLPSFFLLLLSVPKH